jgi:hypothetical protein
MKKLVWLCVFVALVRAGYAAANGRHVRWGEVYRSVAAGGVGAPLSPLAQLPAESLAALWRSDPAYISAPLDSIDRGYGSVAAYVDRELGVSKAEVRALRAKLLTR